MDRAPQVQMRPPAALPHVKPKRRPSPTRVEGPPGSPRPRSAESTSIRPNAKTIVGNRPLRMLKPTERQPISQQDVYSMMGEGGVLDAASNSKATAAREAASARVAARKAADLKARRDREASERRAEDEAYAKVRDRLHRTFGLSSDEPPPADLERPASADMQEEIGAQQ